MRQRFKTARAWLPLVLAAALLASVGGATLARYISTNRTRWQMISAGFHISSDLLKEEISDRVVFGDAEQGTFDVALYNYEVENIAAISELDIRYKVTVANGTLRAVKNGDTDVPYETEGGSAVYTLPAGSARVTHTLKIEPTGAQPVTVTVESVAPYIKRLSARMTVSRGITVTAAPREGGGQLVTVHTNQYSGPLTLTWPGTVTPAAGINEYVHDWTIGYSTAMGGGAYQSTAYRDSAEKEHDYVFELMESNAITQWEIDNNSGTVNLL